MARRSTLSAGIRLVAFVALALVPSLARAQNGQVTLIRSSPEPLPNCTPAVAGQAQPIIWDLTAGQIKVCVGTNTWGGSSTPTLYYQNVDVGGTAQTQQPSLNFINGTNMTISCVNNAGASRTDCTFTATSTAATAFSSLTASTNSNAGTFAASGNTWDFSAATALKVPTVGLIFPGSSSGTTTFAPPATGTTTINIPAAGGTLAVSALGPITLSAAGQVGCATCNVSSATVSSVGVTQTGSVFTITGSPVTSSGSINLAFASVASNLFLASPSGASGVPTMRAIVGADLPAINLASSGAGGVTGILPKANAPATDVYTDQSNTYSAGTQSFVSAVALVLPSSAGFSPTASGSLGYDTTANRYVAGINGTNVILPWFLSGAPVNGGCVTWIGTAGQQGEATCGSGGGGGSGTVNAATQYALPYYSASGSATTVSGVTAPTANGIYSVAYSITGSVASAPIIALPGIVVRANTATTDTILATDRVSLVTESNASAIAVTGPSSLASNMTFAQFNIGAGVETFTPSTGLVNNATTQTVPSKWFGFHYTDGTNAFMPVMPTLGAFPSCSTASSALTFSTTTFVLGCNSINNVTGGGIIGAPAIYTSAGIVSASLQTIDLSAFTGAGVNAWTDKLVIAMPSSQCNNACTVYIPDSTASDGSATTPSVPDGVTLVWTGSANFGFCHLVLAGLFPHIYALGNAALYMDVGGSGCVGIEHTGFATMQSGNQSVVNGIHVDCLNQPGSTGITFNNNSSQDSFYNVAIYNCGSAAGGSGFHMGDQFGYFGNMNLYGNYVNVLMDQAAGVSSNTFDHLKTTAPGSGVNVFMNVTGAGFGDNVFINHQCQNGTVACVAMYGGTSGALDAEFYGGAPEHDNGSSSVVLEGITIPPSGAFYLYNAHVRIDNLLNQDATADPDMLLVNNSVATLTNYSGGGGQFQGLVKTDATSSVNLNGDLVTLGEIFGVATYPRSVSGGSGVIVGAPVSVLNPAVPNFFIGNPLNPAISSSAGVSGIGTTIDPTYGQVLSWTFGTVTGSGCGTNCVQINNIVAAGATSSTSDYLFSVFVKSNVNTTQALFCHYASGDIGLKFGATDLLPLIAGQWTRVVAFKSGVPSGDECDLQMYPFDTVGATIEMTRIESIAGPASTSGSAFTSQSSAWARAQILQNGAVNPGIYSVPLIGPRVVGGGASATNVPAPPLAATEFYAGRQSGAAPGSLNSGQTYADIAIQDGLAGGGFRNWINSQHNAGTTGSVLNFYINTSTTAAGSSGPGTGNTLGLQVQPFGFSATSQPLITNQAPTISSGFGTSPSIVASNGTASFSVNVGTGGTATSGVIGLPSATHGWACQASDVTTTSSSVFMTKQTGTTQTTVTLTDFNTSAVATAWVASDVLQVSCLAN